MGIAQSIDQSISRSIKESVKEGQTFSSISPSSFQASPPTRPRHPRPCLPLSLLPFLWEAGGLFPCCTKLDTFISVLCEDKRLPSLHPRRAWALDLHDKDEPAPGTNLRQSAAIRLQEWQRVEWHTYNQRLIRCWTTRDVSPRNGVASLSPPGLAPSQR